MSVETTCPKCHQVNVRYTGLANVFNRGRGVTCALCGAYLSTDSPVVDSALGPFYNGLRDRSWWWNRWLAWGSIYLVHAFVGAGLAMILMIPLMTRPSAMVFMDRLPVAVRAVPEVLGALGGLALAEWSRRRGTLISNRRSPK